MVWRRGKKIGDVITQKQVIIEGVVYTLTRLIWYIVTGEDPYPLEVEHEDRNHDNNRWINLRLATRSQNNANRYRYGKNDLPRGIYRRGKKFAVYVPTGGKQRYLGLVDHLHEAEKLVNEARLKLFGEFATFD